MKYIDCTFSYTDLARIFLCIHLALDSPKVTLEGSQSLIELSNDVLSYIINQ